MRDQKKVEKIQNKLEKCQARFQTAVSVDTREQVLALLQSQGKMSQTLEDVIYPELKRMHDSTHEQISIAHKNSTAAHETTHKALASLKFFSRASRRAILDAGAQVQGRLDRLQTSHTQRAFLESLEHPDMFARHSQIHAPATGTFEWIFKKRSSRSDQNSRTMELQGRFSNWLRSSQPVFWINGKAGSGKSSLMSFIESHERTHDLLKMWASGRKLHIFSFFFWRAGSEMQKSISGVLRSLLYQLARAKPEMIGSLMGNGISPPERTWTQARLQHAIEKALSHFSEDRIFVLIDGLDEFEGNHTALTKLILGLQNGSHSKFCLSSRPETALTRQLGSFPSLRLQDLNYCDIQNFVYGELGLCRDAFADPQHFHETVHEVVDRAEGIFLWAVLVCKSLISGYESQDDADMLQRRLEATPSGLEALFASMFANIDREHYEYLSRCFFLLRWSKESIWDVFTDVSLPVITAFLSASPHKSLSGFVEDCRVVEHRVLAQAKGLLETYQPDTSMFHNNDQDHPHAGLYILSDALTGNVGYHPIIHEADLKEMHKITCVGWVHRSAYDYIVGDHREYARSWIDVDEAKLLSQLLNSQLWLACYFPGQHMHNIFAPVARIVSVFEGQTGEITIAGFQALDKLHDLIEASCCGRGSNDSNRSLAIGSRLYQMLEEAEPLRAFWTTILRLSRGNYLLTRFDKIKSSAQVDILCSGVLCHPWFWQESGASEAERMMPVLMWSAHHLFNQGSMGCNIVAARPARHFRRYGTYICLSWKGRGTSAERRIVTDVKSALNQLQDLHSRSNDDANRDISASYFTGAAVLMQKLVELSDLWQICYGQELLRLAPPSKAHPSNSLYIHVSATCSGWRYQKEHQEQYATNCSDQAPTVWRFVCFGLGENRMDTSLSNEHVPIVACFDVRARKSKQLLDEYGQVNSNPFRTHITLVGTSEIEALCLETILREVWADADGQFNDGWQQLYMLACLKKYFGTLWNVPIDG
jgi:hypothetical protein